MACGRYRGSKSYNIKQNCIGNGLGRVWSGFDDSVGNWRWPWGKLRETSIECKKKKKKKKGRTVRIKMGALEK